MALLSRLQELRRARAAVPAGSMIPAPWPALTTIAVEPRPPCPTTIAERAAILAESRGCDTSPAERQALAEAGYASWSALADAQRRHIQAELERLPPATNEAGRRLLSVTRAFLETERWREAIALGWPLIELFGASPHAPLVRVGEHGLVTGLALSHLIAPRLAGIHADHAVIVTKSGAQLVHRRCRPAMDTAVLWWTCPEIVGEGGASASNQPLELEET